MKRVKWIICALCILDRYRDGDSSVLSRVQGFSVVYLWRDAYWSVR